MFIDNYAAIPSESVRRLLALHDAGMIEILTLGADYERTNEQEITVIYHHGRRSKFDVFIDARGQRALQSKDILSQRYAINCWPVAMRSRISAKITRCKRRKTPAIASLLAGCRG